MILLHFFQSKKVNIDIELLFQKAKENDKDAQLQLGLAYYRGVGVHKNMQKAFYWIDKSKRLIR